MPERCGLKYQISIQHGVNLEIINKECDRESVRDGRCVCHLDDPNKPIEPLMNDIYRMSETNQVDCAYFIFPREDFRYPNAIRKPLFFEKAKFYGKATFKGMNFGGYTSFHGTEFFENADFSDDGNPYERQTRFHDRVIFSSAVFHKEAQFRSCIFEALPEFQGTVFRGIANFTMVQLAFFAENQFLEFRQVEFLGRAYLDLRKRGAFLGIAFRFCKLSGLVISSLPRNEIPIVFEEIQEWEESKKWFQVKRIKIEDEKHLKDRPVKLLDTYKYLESYFYENSDYSLASHFYVGQMISQLGNPNYSQVSRLLNKLYRLTSNYGESIIRPVLSAIFVWVLTSLLFLSSGTLVHRPRGNELQLVHVNWDITSDIANTNWELFWNDSKSTFRSNIALSTFDRRHELSPPSDSIQKIILVIETLVNLIFASLIVVAARRKFTPKKPTGD